MKQNFNFEPFAQAYFKAYTEPHKLSYAWLTWFVGFCEAECRFTLAKRGDLAFVIAQSQLNVSVLLSIKQRLGFGKVIVQSKKRNSVRSVVLKKI